MHYDVVEKLQDASGALDDMRTASDYQRFKRAFNEALAAVRSVEYKIDSHTTRRLRKSPRRAEVQDFKDWWQQIKDESESDPLLTWAREVRNSDTHVRDNAVFGSSYSIDYLGTDDLMPPPVAGAAMGIGSTGAYWILDEGTVRERRLPAVPRPGTRTAQSQNVGTVWVQNAPTSHRGSTLSSNDPITLVQLTIEYWEGVADRAATEWWGDARP